MFLDKTKIKQTAHSAQKIRNLQDIAISSTGQKILLKNVNKQLKSADIFSKISKSGKTHYCKWNGPFQKLEINCIIKPDYLSLSNLLNQSNTFW